MSNNTFEVLKTSGHNVKVIRLHGVEKALGHCNTHEQRMSIVAAIEDMQDLFRRGLLW